MLATTKALIPELRSGITTIKVIVGTNPYNLHTQKVGTMNKIIKDYEICVSTMHHKSVGRN